MTRSAAVFLAAVQDETRRLAIRPWDAFVAFGLPLILLAVIAAMLAPVAMEEMEWFGTWAQTMPIGNPSGDPSNDPGGKFIPLARLALDMIRGGELDGQPEPLITGAFYILAWTMLAVPPVATDQLEAGLLDVAMAWLERYDPMERIGRTLHIPATIFHVVGDCLSSVAGDDIVQPLLAAPCC